MIGEHNSSTVADLKEGMFFKFLPSDTVKIVLSMQSETFRYMDLSDGIKSVARLIPQQEISILDREKVIKKSVRRGR